MLKFAFILSLLIRLFFYPKNGVVAASINLSNQNSESINDFDQEFETDVTLNINSPDSSKYYLRGVFYKQDTNKYCGLTWNGHEWFDGPFGTNEGWKNLQVIEISSESGSLRLKAKLDKDDGDCNKPGSYGFKVQRYTEGGSGTIDTQNELILTVSVIVPSETLKPEPSPTKQPVKTTANTRSEPSPAKQNLPTVIAETSVPSVTSIIINSSSISAFISKEWNLDYGSAASESAGNHSSVTGILVKDSSNILFVPLFSGISLIFVSSFILFKKIKKIRG